MRVQSAFFPAVAIAAVVAVLSLGAARDEATRDRSVQTWEPSDAEVGFVGINTSRLMGDPEPMPLEPRRVFPRLKFQRPLEFTHAGDGTDRVFVVEQHGLIHVFENRDDVEATEVFLDIRKVVSRRGNEEGLLGLAFHPKYAENGQFFVYYSTTPRASIVSRFRVSAGNPNRADRPSEEVLMRIPQPYSNHNGGSMKFGPDGYLYIGLGDGGAAHDPHGHGQKLGTLLGSILRIDVDREDRGKKYAVPKDNPFVELGQEARGEIWAYGLRNVWRLSFDRRTGELWVGDVGQNRYEEINLITRGGNYGWNIREGSHLFDPTARQTGEKLIDPVVEYFQSEGRSVTGGLVYRGRQLPEFDGAYFYADYVSGNVWIVRMEEGEVIENRKVAATDLPITAFGEDESGEMVLTSFDGHLYRFQHVQGDLRAIAAAFPRKLSETGLFKSVADLKPVAGIIPYDVNVPLWSDGADKERLIALPARNSVVFDATGHWQFPVGTVLIKTFYRPSSGEASNRWRLETRLFLRNNRGWQGYAYKWNDEQTDAELLDGALVEPYRVSLDRGTTQREWYYPSGADCMACHAKSTGFVLGLNTRQLNRSFDYGTKRANQLEHLDEAGMFVEPPGRPASEWDAYPAWGNASAPVDALSRAYLDVNCVSCHAEGALHGPRPDFSFHTPLARTALLNVAPGQGRLGPPDSNLVVPGDPRRSELLWRMKLRGPRQMPPLASNVPDEEAVELLRRWIREMK